MASEQTGADVENSAGTRATLRSAHSDGPIAARGRLGPAWLALWMVTGLGCTLLAQLFGTPPPADPDVGFEVVVPDAKRPVDLAFAPDGRVFYTEKDTGRIRIITSAGELLEAPFATVPVNTVRERGLLGIALHPDFENNGLVYVFYTRSAGGVTTSDRDDVLDQRVVRFHAVGNSADGDEELLLSLPVGTDNHNGGIIRFDPEGKLFICFGDLGSPENSQDPSFLSGKILRVDEHGRNPGDNPFGADSLIYAVGLRNPFGLDFDEDGRPIVNENGSFNHDEVNRIIPGGNYGWPSVEGFADDGSGDPSGEIAFAGANPTYHDPLVDKSDGAVGAVGVAFNNNDAYGAGRRGNIFYGHFDGGTVMRAVLNEAGDSVESVHVLVDGLPANIYGMALAPDGILWVTTASAIVKVVPIAAP